MLHIANCRYDNMQLVLHCCILERNQFGQRKSLSVVSASLHLIIIITNLTTAVQWDSVGLVPAAARNFGNKDHLLLRNFYSPLPDFLFHSRKYGDTMREVLMSSCIETL